MTPTVYEDPVRVRDPSHTWSFSPLVRQPFLYYYYRIQPGRTSTDIPYFSLIKVIAYLASLPVLPKFTFIIPLASISLITSVLIDCVFLVHKKN